MELESCKTKMDNPKATWTNVRSLFRFMPLSIFLRLFFILFFTWKIVYMFLPNKSTELAKTYCIWFLKELGVMWLHRNPRIRSWKIRPIGWLLNLSSNKIETQKLSAVILKYLNNVNIYIQDCNKREHIVGDTYSEWDTTKISSLQAKWHRWGMINHCWSAFFLLGLKSQQTR